MHTSRKTWHAVMLAGLTAWACISCGDSTAPVPTGPQAIKLTEVDSGYNFSVFVAAPPADTSRLLVVERRGTIFLRKHGVRQSTPFLDLSALTGQGHEYGVYSIAFHPQYATNRRLFVYYVDNNADTRVVEYQATPDFDHADPNSQQIILAQPQAAQAVLYGGDIAFGPDGFLYIALGDGRVGGPPFSLAQDSTSLLGKFLRLDVDNGAPYAVPPSNPYVTRAGWRPEIWQLGFRNPWRWSFDRGTGDLYVADVGENTFEEIDYLPAPVVGGNNFGWPIMEGNDCFPAGSNCFTAGLLLPILQYTHQPACAITGGYVYRGARMPALRGTYFYGDYCGGWTRSLRLTAGGPVSEIDPIASPLINDNVVSFGEDAAGEIYVVMASGRIYRIDPN
ncbi:MAG: PQQ-dependent sugar dehydrogenase [Gemmatimonadota bacterium]